MIEKVNPSHPDKIADRIAGAIVDLAYERQADPKIAVEVLIGHGNCYIIIESNVRFDYGEIRKAVYRIVGSEDIAVNIDDNLQDKHLAENQVGSIKCGDNGIFKGVPTSKEEMELSGFVRYIYERYPTDGKYIYDNTQDVFIGCQSNISDEDFRAATVGFGTKRILNPLGAWTGGIDVDTGATNRKLGSDMGRAVTGGGLHGKDLSKADVAVNIYAHMKAQKTNREVELMCAIGDEMVDGKPYSEIVSVAKKFIVERGGFEKLAEWGLF